MSMSMSIILEISSVLSSIGSHIKYTAEYSQSPWVTVVSLKFARERLGAVPAAARAPLTGILTDDWLNPAEAHSARGRRAGLY